MKDRKSPVYRFTLVFLFVVGFSLLSTAKQAHAAHVGISIGLPFPGFIFAPPVVVTPPAVVSPAPNVVAPHPHRANYIERG